MEQKIKEFKGVRSINIPEFVVDRMKSEFPDLPLNLTKIGFYPDAECHISHKEPVKQYVFIYCVAGKGHIQLSEGMETKNFLIVENQFVILPKGSVFTLISKDETPCSVNYIFFDGTMSAYFANNFSVPAYVATSSDSNIILQDKIFEDMYRILETGYNTENMVYTCILLQNFMAKLKFGNQLYGYEDTSKRYDQDLIYASIRFMKENIGRRLTLRQIAEFTGKSVTHYCVEFRKTTGTSPVNYFNELKIKYACQLLTTSRLRINQISYKVGYEDPLYFSKLFTKFTGVTPSEYKQLHSA